MGIFKCVDLSPEENEESSNRAHVITTELISVPVSNSPTKTHQHANFHYRKPTHPVANSAVPPGVTAHIRWTVEIEGSGRKY